MKVLDTTTIIDLCKGKKELSWLLDEGHLFTTPINMYEFIRGLFKRNIPPTDVLELIKIFENIKILPLTENGILKSAEISANVMKKGIMVEDADCLIAGIALSHQISIIVTQNKDHFSRIPGLTVVSY